MPTPDKGSTLSPNADGETTPASSTTYPKVAEDHSRLRDHPVLIDGDADGYLLQIFAKTLVGPIFIERDEAKRGVFNES